MLYGFRLALAETFFYIVLSVIHTSYCPTSQAFVLLKKNYNLVTSMNHFKLLIINKINFVVIIIPF